MKKYTNQVLKNIVPSDKIGLTVEFDKKDILQIGLTVEFDKIGLEIALLRVIEN